jgi:DNA-binding XRE family transcriptional regulator
VAPVRRETAAGIVRDMIADGTLLPGAPAPSGAELARKTGYSVWTCRNALRRLLADGTLAQGASPTARLRVAPAPGVGGTVPATPRASLSRALAARRRAAGLTQPRLAARIGVSVTTVGHAETGRLWQSREFWKQADRALGAAGALLDLYDQHQAAAGSPAADEPSEPPEPPPPPLPVSVAISAAGVLVTWPDGTQTLARAPGWTETREPGE